MMRSAKKTYEIDMLHGAILPKLLRFSRPADPLHHAAAAVQRGGCGGGRPLGW